MYIQILITILFWFVSVGVGVVIGWVWHKKDMEYLHNLRKKDRNK